MSLKNFPTENLIGCIEFCRQAEKTATRESKHTWGFARWDYELELNVRLPRLNIDELLRLSKFDSRWVDSFLDSKASNMSYVQVAELAKLDK